MQTAANYLDRFLKTAACISLIKCKAIIVISLEVTSLDKTLITSKIDSPKFANDVNQKSLEWSSFFCDESNFGDNFSKHLMQNIIKLQASALRYWNEP